jgi:hypothetical protein
MRFAFVSLLIAEDNIVDLKEDDDATHEHCTWFQGDFLES